MQEIFQIRKNVWHVQDEKNVFFTLIIGSQKAIVVDSGYGKADHRAFVETHISTPYVVLNSHGHPDHVGGNSQYETVYVDQKDLALAQKNGSKDDLHPRLCVLPPNTAFDLGDLHVKTIPLPGHTKGTVGFLVEEHRLLIAGDAFNPDMWMFAENHDTLDTLEQTLRKALLLPFDTYLGSHSLTEIPQPFLKEALANVREKKIDWLSAQRLLGKDTYAITHQGVYGNSVIHIEKDEALRIQRLQEQGFQTCLVHGAEEVNFGEGATLPPIVQSSAFAHETAEETEAIFAKKQSGYNYSRIGNPTIRAFEERMTALEHGAASVAFASGMAAITATLLNILSAGDDFVSTAGLYGGTVELFKGLKRFGIRVHYVPVNDLQALAKSITPRVKLIYAETISNPGLNVADVRRMAEIAHAHGIPLILDNTMATPCLLQPIAWGADIVIHSSSKYINGSGAGVSGVVTDSGRFVWDPERFASMEPLCNQILPAPPFAARLRADMLCNHGACLSPQNAFLNLLGLETMGLRMEKACANALAFARYFRTVPDVQVNYPGLEESPDYLVASSMLKGGFGAILTVRFGTKKRAFQVMDRLTIPKIVSNIGDNRTLVIHPASTMALHSTDQEREAAGVYEDLVRISVGIEDSADLICDFDAALQG